ncbi:MAG: short chain dehydrogenase [Candidatus Hydrogenedentota bacterium]|nr:MAG: short chain dehydrogenase [Candidatus Hydrogenedentota bacterium]
MSSFRDKTIIITGASEGIGRALALELAPQRPKLVLAARNRERLESIAAECEELGTETLIVPTDVTSEDGCKNLVEQAVKRFGGMDVLVNNAGGTMWELFENVEEISIFEHLMRLNYLSGVFCTYHALPHLKESRGLIVGISSIAGMTGVPTRTGYAASKHAQFGFFDSLRIELKGTGVDVTMIAPDFVVTQIHKRALKGDGTPLVDTPLKEENVMSARECAMLIIDGMEQRKRLVIGSSRGKLGRWLKLFLPEKMDEIARKAIDSGQ